MEGGGANVDMDDWEDMIGGEGGRGGVLLLIIERPT